MHSAGTGQHSRRKSERLKLCLSREQRRILDEAAAASGMSVGAFVLDHATESARDLLAGHSSVSLPAGRWESFVAMLDGF